MLAIQRPSMGSSKPPNLEMPFGYSFDTSSSNFPFPSPPALAPGPSLLDDNESKFLDSFFDGVSSDHFNYDFFNHGPDSSELGMGWDELPPTFMGTSSSFGQQPQMGQRAPGLHFADMTSHINPTPSIPPSTSADVLAAATLLQNGSTMNGRSQSMAGELLRQHVPMHLSNGQLRPQSMSEQGPARAQALYQQRTSGDGFLRDNYYTDMMFGTTSENTLRQQRVEQKGDIRWGSDAGFGTAQGFIAPASQENPAESERAHLHAIEQAFTLTAAPIPSSADSTRPSSPARPQERRTESTGPKNHEDEDSRPRKRRKSRYKEEEDDDDDDDDDDEIPSASAPKQNAKKRKSIKRGLNQSPQPELGHGHKRKKSATAAPKPTRENLTEDQKRENHIKSEQKRRTLIREGFEDLNELVPGLRGGGFSKSAVLIMAADWLEELMQGNQVLQAQLNQMEGR